MFSCQLKLLKFSTKILSPFLRLINVKTEILQLENSGKLMKLYVRHVLKKFRNPWTKSNLITARCSSTVNDVISKAILTLTNVR